jgi:hypothetical protein
MCSGESDWTCLQPGFPIRKSSDHSLVIDSPRLIADSYVLLRFLVPRHPPFALINLSHKDARVHCVVLKVRAAPPRLGAYCHKQRFIRREGPGRSTGLRIKLAPEALRTQQRVRRRHPLVRVPLSEDLYLRGELMSAPNNRCSTLEHLLSDIRTQTRLWIACATSAP